MCGRLYHRVYTFSVAILCGRLSKILCLHLSFVIGAFMQEQGFLIGQDIEIGNYYSICQNKYGASEVLFSRNSCWVCDEFWTKRARCMYNKILFCYWSICSALMWGVKVGKYWNFAFKVLKFFVWSKWKKWHWHNIKFWLYFFFIS